MGDARAPGPAAKAAVVAPKAAPAARAAGTTASQVEAEPARDRGGTRDAFETGYRCAPDGRFGTGEPLPGPLRVRFESQLGFPLDGVRVHHDPRAAAWVGQLGANAATTGHHIAFADGRYTPSTPAGQRLIAHELVHVAQQANGFASRALSRPGDATETEAAQVGDRIAAGRAAGPIRAQPAMVARDSFTGVGPGGEVVVNEPASMQRYADKMKRASVEQLYYQLAESAGNETRVFSDNASVEDLEVYLRANPGLKLPAQGDYLEAVHFLLAWDDARKKLPHVAMRLDQKLSGTVAFRGDKYPIYYTGQTPPAVGIDWTRNAATNFWLGYYSRNVLSYRWEMVGPSGKAQRLVPLDGFVQTTAASSSLDDPGNYYPRVTISMLRGGPGNEVTFVGPTVTAMSATRAEFAADEFRKSVTEKDAEGNDPSFDLDRQGLPTTKQGVKPLGLDDQIKFNQVRIGALKAYRDQNKISKSDFENAQKYFEARNEGITTARSSLPGGGNSYVVSGVFVSSERPLSIPIHAYMASRPNRAGKFKVTLYDATLDQKTPTEHSGDAAVPNGPFDHDKRVEAERAAVEDMGNHWKANNDYPPGTVYLAISSHENPHGGIKLTIPQSNWKKSLRSILGGIAAVAGLAALVFGQVEISVPLMTVAGGAGLANIALGIEHRVKMGTFGFDGALAIDVLSVGATLMGLGAISKTFQEVSYAGRAWYLVGMGAADATQGILIGHQAAAALDDAKAEFNGAMATAKTADERQQAQQHYQQVSHEIIGGAIASEAFIVVSLVGTAVTIGHQSQGGAGRRTGAPPILPEPEIRKPPTQPHEVPPTRPPPAKPTPVPEQTAPPPKAPPAPEVTTPPPAKPEPVKPEPVKPEPVKPEPVEPEPVKPEPVEPAPVTEPVTEPVKSEPPPYPKEEFKATDPGWKRWPPPEPSTEKPAWDKPGGARYRYDRYRYKKWVESGKSNKPPPDLMGPEEYFGRYVAPKASGQSPGELGSPGHKRLVLDVRARNGIGTRTMGEQRPDAVGEIDQTLKVGVGDLSTERTFTPQKGARVLYEADNFYKDGSQIVAEGRDQVRQFRADNPDATIVVQDVANPNNIVVYGPGTQPPPGGRLAPGTSVTVPVK